MAKKAKSMPHIYEGRFYNQPGEQVHHVLLPSAVMYVRSLVRRWIGPRLDVTGWFEPAQPPERSIAPVITWIGHATFLIQVGGLNILTDPLFNNPSVFFRRILPPGIALKKLPPIDVVLISHNHPDHMSSACLRYIKKFQPHVLVPSQLGSWFARRGFKNIHERQWWQSITIPAPGNESVTFTFLPAWHWSQRGLFDRNKTLWGSWLICHKGQSIYFGGDTSYAGHFKEIGQEYPFIKTALLPIGPCEPKKWMEHVHMSSDKAVQSFLDLQATQLVPMHWGTFHFGIDQFTTPIDQLQDSWKRYELEPEKLIIAKVGKPTFVAVHNNRSFRPSHVSDALRETKG